jgi:hypothetical protein
MADLLDIAASTAVRAVWINGNRTTVRGLSANSIAFIISRFPDVEKLLVDGVDDPSVMPRLIQQLGAAVGPVIAAGCGYLGDEKQEQAGAMLPVDDQATLFEPIWMLTFPNGIGSFVERMRRMRRLIVAADEGAKTVKLRSKKSPSTSPPSSDAGSRQTMQ